MAFSVQADVRALNAEGVPSGLSDMEITNPAAGQVLQPVEAA